MKKSETQKITVRTTWQMFTNATDLVFALYNGMQSGGVDNPMALLGGNRSQAAPDTSKDSRIKPLYNTIEKYRKCCEQEKLARHI